MGNNTAAIYLRKSTEDGGKLNQADSGTP